MSEYQTESATLTVGPSNRLDRVIRRVEWIAQPWLVQMLLRLAIAVPFLKSGLLKWDDFLQLNETVIYLFTDEFRLHLPGGPYAFPAPALVAFLAACGEVFLPLLLILGLGTRLAALGIVLMTIVIQITVPEGWPVHLTWVAIALAIAAFGPGRLSVDYLLGDRRLRSR
ncbi:DoxX family protein [Advenella mimigardefordensis]|nr:DoxX family protein [Advenella mimigardefordensis]